VGVEALHAEARRDGGRERRGQVGPPGLGGGQALDVDQAARIGQVRTVAVEEQVGAAAHERLEVAGIGAITGHVGERTPPPRHHDRPVVPRL